MTTPDTAGPASHVLGFRKEITNVSVDQDAFFGWFNNQESFEEAHLSGAWDFAWHFAAPLAPHLGQVVTAGRGLTALEIGCGGGRLLAHAARLFHRVIGVDVHGQLDLVGTKLRELGVHNAELRQSDGLRLPCANAEVDVVYSYIVFQHLETIVALKANLQEAYRVLKPGGLAMIYAGRLRTWTTHRNSRLRLWCDLCLERLRMPKGYQEVQAPINSTNLRVTRTFMLGLARRIGFMPLMTCVSRRRVPMETAQYGGQYGFLLRKPLQ